MKPTQYEGKPCIKCSSKLRYKRSDACVPCAITRKPKHKIAEAQFRQSILSGKWGSK